MAAARPNTFKKIIILGDTNTGKTSLMNRYVNNKYTGSYKATIGADFLTKNVMIGDRTVSLQIWDTAGRERFQSLGVAFYRGSDACVLVYDVTDPKSFKSLQVWRQEFLNQAAPSDPASFPFVVMGNKMDLEKERHAVPEEKVRAWCAEQAGAIPFFPVSAKMGTNVEQAFLDVITRAVNRAQEDEMYIPGDVNLNIKETSTTSSDGPCAC